MTVSVVVTDGILARPGRYLMTYRAPFGMTIAELMDVYTPPHWRTRPEAIHAGELVTDLDVVVPDGGGIFLAPMPGDFLNNAVDWVNRVFGGDQRAFDNAGNLIDDPRPFYDRIGDFFNNIVTFGAAIYYGGTLAGWWGPQSVAQRAQDVESPTYGWEGVRTSLGPGHLIPTVWGETISAGHVLYAQIWVTGISLEYIILIAALSEGRLYAVGDVTGGGTGEVGQMGRVSNLGFLRRVRDLPAGIKINGVKIDPEKDDDLMMELRLGEAHQHPLTTAFQGVSTIVTVGSALNNKDDEATFVISTTERLYQIDFILAWPNGCWEDLGNGTVKGFLQEFEFAYRRPDVGNTWVVLHDRVDLTPLPIRGGSSRMFGMLPNPIFGGYPGPMEVRVKRLSPNGGAKVQSQCLLRQVGWKLQVQLAYPRIAHVGVVQKGSEMISSKVPQYEFRVKGRMVRTWDKDLGFSAYVWDTTDFATVDPAFDGIWSNPPGRNPAWLELEYLLAVDGLGPWLTSADINLQAFRNWADNCDGDLGDGAPAGTPRYQFDHVMDTPKASWDQVQIFARAGRARILPVGNQITVDYDYTAAHGRGTNTVGARVATWAVGTSNVRGFTMNYLPTADRATVIQFQFLNKNKDYKRDVLPVEDPDNDLNVPYVLGADQYVLQTFDRFEVTEPTQLQRDGLMMHGANRKLKYACEFVAASDALPVLVGDVFKAQADVIQPFDSDPYGYRMGRTISSEDFIQLDHEVVLAAATTYTCVVALADGTLQTVTITEAPGTIPAFTDMAITAATSLVATKEAVVIFGVLNETTLEFQVRSISLTGSMDRRVQALQWDPTVHDDIYVVP